MIFRGITGEVITGFASKSSIQNFIVSNIYTSIGNECASQSPKSFVVGRVNTTNGLKEESSVMYFDLSKVGNQQIESAEFCIAKVNGNNYGFEFFISGENGLECPRILPDFFTRRSTKIAGRKIDSFYSKKPVCFDVTGHVKRLILNNKSDIYLGLSGMALTKSKQTYNYFYGFESSKTKPYLQVTYSKKSTASSKGVSSSYKKSQANLIKDFGISHLEINSLNKIERLKISNTYDTWTEIPPFTINSKGGKRYFLTTSQTLLCENQKNLLFDSVLLNNCKRIMKGESEYNEPKLKNLPYDTPWKRSYYGAYSAEILNNNLLITFNHGENKNWNNYQNSINKNVNSNKCYNHAVNGVMQCCWSAYNAFVGMSWINYNSDTDYGLKGNFKDEGPIIWPSNGYLDSRNKKTSRGLRHPNSIVYDRYIYVFYLDQAFGKYLNYPEKGRASGIKVARSLVSSKGLPGTFMNYYNGEFNQPSLPKGFKETNIYSFLKVKGPLADTILDNGLSDSNLKRLNSISFSVAHIRGTDSFLGIEYFNKKGGKLSTCMRFSNDLVHWSGCMKIPGEIDKPWKNQLLLYPSFMDKDGISDKEIDANDFYIVGTDYYGNVYKHHLSVTLYPLQCSEDSDCGIDFNSINYCDLNSVFFNSYNFKCENRICNNNLKMNKVKDCSVSCSEGECEDLVCKSNSDCGTDDFTGDSFCISGNNSIYQNYTSYSCNNSILKQGSCLENTLTKKVMDCESNQICEDGECIDI